MLLERLIAEREADEGHQKLSDERFVREQRILEEQAPGVWKRLRSAIRTQCEKYPRQFKFDVCVDAEVLVRGANHKVLTARFLRESKAVEFECNGGSGMCAIRLGRDNVAVLCDQDRVVFPSEEYAAEQLLSLILL